MWKGRTMPGSLITLVVFELVSALHKMDGNTITLQSHVQKLTLTTNKRVSSVVHSHVPSAKGRENRTPQGLMVVYLFWVCCSILSAETTTPPHCWCCGDYSLCSICFYMPNGNCRTLRCCAVCGFALRLSQPVFVVEGALSLQPESQNSIRITMPEFIELFLKTIGGVCCAAFSLRFLEAARPAVPRPLYTFRKY